MRRASLLTSKADTGVELPAGVTEKAKLRGNTPDSAPVPSAVMDRVGRVVMVAFSDTSPRHYGSPRGLGQMNTKQRKNTFTRYSRHAKSRNRARTSDDCMAKRFPRS